MESLGIEISVILMAIITYFFAAIPFGLVLAKIFGLGDIRQVGSGNIGATNVLRTGNKKAAVLTLLCDGLKGALPVLFSAYFLPGHEYSIGFLAIFAHIFPVYLKFKGGKGVATMMGVYLAWNLAFGICVLLTWLIIAKIFKISSLSALIAAFLAPLFAYLFQISYVLPFSGLIFGLILYTHRSNIKRIINKQESLIL